MEAQTARPSSAVQTERASTNRTMYKHTLDALRQTLRRSESMLDATVGPSLRSGGSGEQRDAIMALHVAVNSERQRRAKAEDELRSTEELVALKLEDLKSLSRRVKRLENENDLQVALEQESQKTFEYLGNEVGATKAKRTGGCSLQQTADGPSEIPRPRMHESLTDGRALRSLWLTARFRTRPRRASGKCGTTASATGSTNRPS